MTDKLVQGCLPRCLPAFHHARVYAIATTEPRLHGGRRCFAEPGPLAGFLRSGIATHPS